MLSIREKPALKINGFVMVLLFFVMFVAAIWSFIMVGREHDPSLLWFALPDLLIAGLLMPGFFVVHPNEARVVVFLGRYTGSVLDAGFWWTNPLTIKRKVSLRVHNFNSERLKVNDLNGNPVEIAAVVVWHVVDSAKALFDVENYEAFVGIQSETAIRSLASQYPYDAHADGQASLRGSTTEVLERLTQEVDTRLELAGVEITDARISHLAYSPEIAQAMLRRQQAEAIVAARQKIVEGAVGMVQEALQMLSERDVVHLDEERKASMVNNLLVALVADREAQPVLNTGTLYA